MCSLKCSGPSKVLLRDCEIFGNLRITFYSSSRQHVPLLLHLLHLPHTLQALQGEGRGRAQQQPCDGARQLALSVPSARHVRVPPRQPRGERVLRPHARLRVAGLPQHEPRHPHGVSVPGRGRLLSQVQQTVGGFYYFHSDNWRWSVADCVL